MRVIAISTFRRLLLLSIGAVILLIFAGCARKAPAVSPAKPARPLINEPAKLDKAKQPKNKPQMPPAKSSDKPEDPGPSLVVNQKGITLHWTTKQGAQMSARASSGRFDEITKTGMLLDFSGQLYENDRLTATMRAPKAVADNAKRIVTATGGVTMKSLERQTVVKASWIKWYANAHKVVGGGGARITSTSGSVDCPAFIADTDLRTLTVQDSVKGLEY